MSSAVHAALDSTSSWHPGRSGDTHDADALWILLDQMSKEADQHRVFDVVWLADLKSFSGVRWARCIQPLRIASGHFGATIRTVCADVTDEENSKKAQMWTAGLMGSLVLLRNSDFETGDVGQTQKDSVRLTASAAASVFDILARWRGCLLFHSEDEAGSLEYMTCRIQLDALALDVAGRGESLAASHSDTRTKHVADAAQHGKIGKRSSDKLTTCTEPLAHGVVSRSNYVRVCNVVDGATIPPHLIAAGALSLRLEPADSRERRAQSALMAWIARPRAVVIACVETWQSTDKRSVDHLLKEGARESDQREQRCRAHVMKQHAADPEKCHNAAETCPCELVSQRLITIQRDACCMDRLLVSTFRYEDLPMPGHGLTCCESYGPHARSFFSAQNCSLPRDILDPSFVAPGFPRPVDQDAVATLPRKRHAWCALVPLSSTRLRLESLQASTLSTSSPTQQQQPCRSCMSDPVREESVESSEAHVSGACAGGKLEAVAASQVLKIGLGKYLGQMASCEFQALANADAALSGSAQEVSHLTLPKEKEMPRRKQSTANSSQSCAWSRADFVEKCGKMRACLSELGHGVCDGALPISGSPFSKDGAFVSWDRVNDLQSADSWDPGQRAIWDLGIDVHLAPQDDVCLEDGVQRCSATINAPGTSNEARDWARLIRQELQNYETQRLQATRNTPVHSHTESSVLKSALQGSCAHGGLGSCCRVGTCRDAVLHGSLYMPPSPKKPRHTTKNDVERRPSKSRPAADARQSAPDSLAASSRKAPETGHKRGPPHSMRPTVTGTQRPAAGAAEGPLRDIRKPQGTSAVSPRRSRSPSGKADCSRIVTAVERGKPAKGANEWTHATKASVGGAAGGDKAARDRGLVRKRQETDTATRDLMRAPKSQGRATRKGISHENAVVNARQETRLWDVVVRLIKGDYPDEQDPVASKVRDKVWKAVTAIFELPELDQLSDDDLEETVREYYTTVVKTLRLQRQREQASEAALSRAAIDATATGPATRTQLCS